MPSSGPMPVPIDPSRTALPAGARVCDVLVVGGGINGAGIARDAAGRGLSVLLCEQDDLAGYTSSASTKLIHGVKSPMSSSGTSTRTSLQALLNSRKSQKNELMNSICTMFSEQTVVSRRTLLRPVFLSEI